MASEVAATSDARAVNRAKAACRRYARTYSLDHMWTLTYAGEGCHDREQMKAHMEEFARVFKTVSGGAAWLAVPELHPGGHGWHVHLAISGYMWWKKLHTCWTHGNIKPSRYQGSVVIDPAILAGYLTKYLAKSFGVAADVNGEQVPTRNFAGEHRYFRAKSTPVEVIRRDYSCYLEAYKAAIIFFDGEAPAFTWESAKDSPELEIPPAAWMDFWPRRSP